jgi:mutator protein MutT
MVRPVSIAIAVVIQAGCVLAGRRREGVPLAGLWEFPGGKALDGEALEQAAERECKEESGIDVQCKSLICRIEHLYAHGGLDLAFFECQPNSQDAPMPPFSWVRVDDALRLEFPDANRPVLDWLRRRNAADCCDDVVGGDRAQDRVRL